MRLLVPVVVLLATILMINRQPPQAGAAEVSLHPVLTIEIREGSAFSNREGGTKYDEVIESAGLLNRLELLDF